ncbi:MAG: PGPGW domain-containing protein [Phycisphaerales bacterium]|jgi:hypothetical protein
MAAWIGENAQLVWYLSLASAIMFVGSLLLAPELIVRIPRDYFAHPHRPPSRWLENRPGLRFALKIMRNIVGSVVLVAGVAMLVLPGQGLLTMLVGIVIMDFPKKYELERWLVSRSKVYRAVNWIRSRRGREPLFIEPESATAKEHGP